MNGIRKYGSLLMLMIMSLSFACLAVDAYCETSEAILQCQSVSDSLMVDDIDLDQYECDVLSVRHQSRTSGFVRVHADMSISSDLAKAKISRDLKIGLVRRYSPEDSSFSWVNYVWTFHVINNNGSDCNAVIPFIFFSKLRVL